MNNNDREIKTIANKQYTILQISKLHKCIFTQTNSSEKKVLKQDINFHALPTTVNQTMENSALTTNF